MYCSLGSSIWTQVLNMHPITNGAPPPSCYGPLAVRSLPFSS